MTGGLRLLGLWPPRSVAPRRRPTDVLRVREPYLGDRGDDLRPYARGEDPGKLLPAVHQVISLAKRWLLAEVDGIEQIRARVIRARRDSNQLRSQPAKCRLKVP